MKRRDALILAGTMAAPAIHAQEAFPGNRTLTLTVGFAPGGVGDMVMRQLSESARAKRGVQTVVDFRPGAGSSLSLERISRATPDGTQVALGSVSALWIIPHQQQLGYDPRQLTGLGQISGHPLAVYVKTDSPLRSWADLLAYARANPGKLSWGTTGSRGFAEVLVEAAFRHEGVQTSTVPFRGGAEAIAAMIGGHIDAVASADFGPMLAQGAVRLLAETGPNKVPGHPEVPTFRELGYPLSDAVAYGVVGPPGIPRQAVQWWQEVIRETTADPAFVAALRRIYAVPDFLDAEAYTQSIRDGYARFGAALRG
jgi:tripartite-type tricarboxylate transporter receptor subunit TctC